MSADLVIPTPNLVIPGFADLPEPIQAVIERLSQPFPLDEVKVRPGAVRRDGTAALCLAYGDWWTMYLPRLNDEIGPNNWTITLRPWGEHQIIARLNAFGGLIVSESTGSAKGEANGAQEAEIQAKKRACAEGLMLGLYMYFLPNIWGKGERVGKEFSFADGEEQRCVHEMYTRAGLIARRVPSSAIPHNAPRPEPPRAPRPAASGGSAPPAAAPRNAAPTAPSAPINERAAAARAVLNQAEQQVGLRPHAAVGGADPSSQTTSEVVASDAQLGLIARLITGVRAHDAQGDVEAINRLGDRFGIASLADLGSREQLRAHAITKRNATKLIDALKALDPTTVAPTA